MLPKNAGNPTEGGLVLLLVVDDAVLMSEGLLGSDGE